jgi:hypothetical protein
MGGSKLNRILLLLFKKHIHPKFKHNDVNHFVLFIFLFRDMKENLKNKLKVAFMAQDILLVHFSVSMVYDDMS